MDKEIEIILKEIHFSIEKLKKKYKNDKEKNSIIILLRNKYNFLNQKYNNIEINTNKEQKAMSLSTFLQQTDKKDPGSNDLINNESSENGEEGTERSIIEQGIIDEFNIRKLEQNVKIDELGNKISDLKILAEDINNQIKGINVKVTKVIPEMVIVVNNVKSKNEMVTDLIKQIRKPSKFCCDIVLILILLGLICALISIIRHKYC